MAILTAKHSCEHIFCTWYRIEQCPINFMPYILQIDIYKEINYFDLNNAGEIYRHKTKCLLVVLKKRLIKDANIKLTILKFYILFNNCEYLYFRLLKRKARRDLENQEHKTS